MRRWFTVLFMFCALILTSTFVSWGEETIPPGHWAYSALFQLAEAGLLSAYPNGWIVAGHPLTRHEFAFYIRTAILSLEQEEGGEGRPQLKESVELALGRLVTEFLPELRAFGVNIEPWAENTDRAAYIDLDNLVSAIGQRPEVPPANAPPGEQETDPALQQIDLSSVTYRPLTFEPFRIPLSDFRNSPGNLIGLAGEVLGADWTLDLDEDHTYQEVFGLPLRIGGFVITSETASMQSGLELRLGEQLGIGFDALLFLDLDQAQMAMNLLLVDVSTEFEFNERLGLFGSLSLEFRQNTLLNYDLNSQAIAGLRILLGGDRYLIAEYSLANPFSENLPHWQGPTLGLSLGDIGLILLGMQTTDLSGWESLELSGLFIYRF